jgi:hypothetical protein
MINDMKNIYLVLFIVLCGIKASAQDSTLQHSDNPANPPGGEIPQNHYRPTWSGQPDKYCATLMGGKITIVYKGKPILDDKTLANGTRIMKDGTLILPNGTRHALKNKECVDGSGNLQ